MVMATTVSFINMKGGVGKTTLAAQIIHAADVANFRVLAVDLDPQSNLSQSLMRPEPYVRHLRSHKPTVVQLFDQYRPPSVDEPSPRPVEIEDIIIKKAGYWTDTTVDLIPSRLELARTLKNPTGKERKLAKALAKVSNQYDLIIIDCAPTESILTDAAYFASRYLLVPIKPEFMAAIGLPLLARSLTEFKLENDDHEIDICGIVFNHSSSYSSGPEGKQSIREVTKFAEEQSWQVFDNHIGYSASYANRQGKVPPFGKRAMYGAVSHSPFSDSETNFLRQSRWRRRIMDNRFLELELRLLVARYGRPQVLQGLAKLTGSTVEAIESQMKEIEQRTSARTSKRKSTEAILEEITAKNPASRSSLQKLLALYESRTFLPHLRSVKSFLERRGHSTTYKSRHEALPDVMRLLATLGDSELRTILESALRTDTSSDYSLLANEIISPHRRVAGD
jgi:chromosome partitioning protein